MSQQVVLWNGNLQCISSYFQEDTKANECSTESSLPWRHENQSFWYATADWVAQLCQQNHHGQSNAEVDNDHKML